MKPAARRSYFRSVFLTMWAMATAVMVFCICLLVYEMKQRGQQILPMPAQEQVSGDVPSQTPMPGSLAATQEVQLFFAAGDTGLLAAEPRRIEFSDQTVENCRHALEALIQGPRDREAFRPICSEATVVRALYLLEGGELVVDFSREIVTEHKRSQSTASEALLLYGMVQTLTQAGLKGARDQEVRSVRFLVEGAAPRDSYPAHLDVTKPLNPDPQWVQRPNS